MEKFTKGTNGIAKVVADAADNKGLKVLVGGGETGDAIRKSGVSTKNIYISSGGGSTLEFLEKNGNLPGITILDDCN